MEKVNFKNKTEQNYKKIKKYFQENKNKIKKIKMIQHSNGYTRII